MRVVVIGGGASGFFTAINLASLHPQHEVILLEKTSKLLSKVKISGGGRCNVTHHCDSKQALLEAYPRGKKFLRQVFHKFSTQDTIDWFQARNVTLKVEADGRMFPTDDRSQTIIDCFLREAKKYKVVIQLRSEVMQLLPVENRWRVILKNKPPLQADRVVVASGGSPQLKGLNWLAALGHHIVPPVPSLFTFNFVDKTLMQLQGVAVPKVKVSILKKKLVAEGALLITHWGLSGPAVLRLSAWGARQLYDTQYDFTVQISWLNDYKEEALVAFLHNSKHSLKQRQIGNKNPFQLPKRLWEYLIARIDLPFNKKWIDLSKKDMYRLVNVLLYDTYGVKGKTTFKEEFVTCGGIALEDVQVQTMESKVAKGLYFTGEVLDIDGITGGYNFQAAWATAFVAAQALGAT